MITWIDKSDRGTRFLQGDLGDEPTSTETALESIVRVLLDQILGSGNASQFELLMLEVNCDTGRLIASAATEHGWKIGHADGCCIRVQEIQDYWYDLLEAGIDQSRFTSSIRQQVVQIGREFKSRIDSSSESIRSRSGSQGFRLVVFGNSPGDVVFAADYK